MIDNEYPIIPTFITKLNLEHDNLNKYGIFDKITINGFLSSISQEKYINSPISLFEFLPENHADENKIQNTFKAKNNRNDKIIHETGNKEFFNEKLSYSLFRKYINENTSIIDIDKQKIEIISLLAHPDINRQNIINTLLRYLDQRNDFKKYKISILEPDNKNRVIIKYVSTINGMTNFIFPIFHEDKVLGCFLLENIISADLTATNILENYQHCFETYRIKLNEKQNSNLILNIHRDFENEKAKYTSQIESVKNYSDWIYLVLNTIQKVIESFEDQIHISVEFHRYKYISNVFLKIKEKFRDDFLKKSSAFNLSDLYPIVNNSLESLVKTFYKNHIFIRIFANSDSSTNKLSLLFSSNEIENNTRGFYFDLNRIPSEILNNNKPYVERFEKEDKNPQQNKYLIESFFYNQEKAKARLSSTDVFTCFPLLSNKLYFIVWEGNSSKSKYAKENRDYLPQDYFSQLTDFYTFIMAHYAAIWGSVTEKKLQDTIRIAGHESNQIIPRIIDSLQLKIDLSSDKNSYNKQGLDDIIDHINLLKFVNEKPAYIFKSVDLKLTEVDISACVNKIVNLYKTQCRHKDIEIYLKLKTKVPISADKVLFEHTINNLIDNAVKYCYRGTSIIINGEYKINYTEMSIISFGPQILDTTGIFQLYKREQNYVEGLGIGMYIVKKVIDAHHWKINVDSVQVHKFNIPYLNYFLQYKTNKNMDDLLQFCNDELKSKLKDITELEYSKYKEVLLQSDRFMQDSYQKKSHSLFRPGPRSFSQEITKPTYKNKFTIKISH